jgi:hypothetical protein
MRLRCRLPLALALAAALWARPANAQDRIRFGVVFGGLGFVGAVVEGVWDDRSVEAVVSTFSFRDVSISFAGKQFFGASWLKPALGAGLTYMVGSSPDGVGSALIARFPLGGDWKLVPGHYATWEVNVTRALLVNRPDPADDTPPTQRIIPFPSFSYRLVPGDL